MRCWAHCNVKLFQGLSATEPFSHLARAVSLERNHISQQCCFGFSQIAILKNRLHGGCLFCISFASFCLQINAEWILDFASFICCLARSHSKINSFWNKMDWKRNSEWKCCSLRTAFPFSLSLSVTSSLPAISWFWHSCAKRPVAYVL